MINALTKDQEAQIPIYRDKWIDIGLSTEQLPIKEIKKIISAFNKNILKEEEKPILVFNSPIESWYFINWWMFNKNLTESQVGSQVESQVWSQIASQVESQVGSQIWSQVRSQVESQVGSQVRSQIASQVWSQVWSQVRSQVASQVALQVGSQVESQVWSQVNNLKLINFIYPYLSGSFDSSYFSYIDFYKNVIKLKNLPQYKLIKNYLDISKIGFIFPLKDIIVVCQKPNLIKKNNNGLHCANGPALTYNDNGLTEIYALNGVRMAKEHVMTPGEQISAKTVFEEKNVEVRRELLRKIGIEKFLEIAPHKSLDKQGNYELFSIELSEEIKDAKYLKMVNPSIGCFHLEGVAPECKTVEHALNWRTYQDINKSWKPAILT